MKTPPPSAAVPIMPFNVNLLFCRWDTKAEWRFDLCAPLWRIYWMASEGWYIRYNGKSLAMDSRSVVVLPPNTPCSAESRKAATQFYVHFTVEPINDLFQPGVYFLPLTQNSTSLITSLMDTTADPLRGFLAQTLQIKQLCYDCLSRLPKKDRNIHRYSPRIVAAIKVLSKNIRNPASNVELAKSIGMNTNAFIRLFHQEVGLSPQKWYTEKRIDQAALFLSHTTKSIEVVAEETGYSDRNHFSRAFKKSKGTGPADYRRQFKKSIS